MRISILYFQGCPNHPPTAKMVRQAVAESGLDARVEEVELTTLDDAQRLRFLGSPTVQVDGVDIEPAARSRTDFAMACRLYDTPDGLPSRTTLLVALGVGSTGGATAASPARGGADDRDCCDAGASRVAAEHAVRTAGERSGMVAVGGSVITAMLSSACCWVPLLLLAFGMSAVGVSAFFEAWRPVFIVVAVMMLGLGFYFAYIRTPAPAADCCSPNTANSRRLQRTTLWVSTAIVTAFVFFPQYVGVLLDGASPAAAAQMSDVKASARQFSFRIEGMHCAGCAVTLKSELAKIAGVQDVRVDYATKTARVAASDDTVVPRVVDATQRAGFSGVLRTARP